MMDELFRGSRALERHDAPMLRGGDLASADMKRVFGEALPVGLKL
jgi:hypothetical protein